MISILLKTTFWQTSIHSQNHLWKFVAIGQEQNHFKGDWNMNIGMVSEKLYRNTLKWVPIYFFELGNVKVLVLTFKTSLKTAERDRIERMDVGGLQRGKNWLLSSNKVTTISHKISWDNLPWRVSLTFCQLKKGIRSFHRGNKNSNLKGLLLYYIQLERILHFLMANGKKIVA